MPATGAHWSTTAGATHQVVEIFGRRALAEHTDIVDKLHSHIAANGQVVGGLHIVWTYRGVEVAILVKNIVYTYAQLAPLVFENLLTNIGVAEQELLIVVVGQTAILVISGISCEGKASPSHPLELASGVLAKILVVLVGQLRPIVVDVVR